MVHNPKYYRARISAILHVLSDNRGRKEKTSPEELLKYGYVHEDIQHEINDYIEQSDESNSPLSFTEKTSFNTWFAMHPEKIAGQELLTTSREFPITIKGTKEDIIRTIQNTTKQNNRVRIAKIQAQAKIKLLNLLTI